MENENLKILGIISNQLQTLICAVNMNNQYQAEILGRLNQMYEKLSLCEIHLYKVKRDIKGRSDE